MVDEVDADGGGAGAPADGFCAPAAGALRTPDAGPGSGDTPEAVDGAGGCGLGRTVRCAGGSTRSACAAVALLAAGAIADPAASGDGAAGSVATGGAARESA
ncbi:MAG: hypothetical protein AB7Q17_12565 [Phycisphaerae bacterium]